MQWDNLLPLQKKYAIMSQNVKQLVSAGVMALSILGMPVHARQLSEQDALARASEYLNSAQGRSAMQALKPSDVNLVYTAQKQGQSYFYIFNRGDNGFLIAGADDRVPAVLAYSEAGTLDMSDIPDNFKYWMGEYSRQIQWIFDNPARIGSRSDESSGAYPVVEPILTTKWSQIAPYNGKCPMNGKNRTITGATAVAMAQIMHHYRWPEMGSGSISYECSSLDEPQTLNVDFENTVYDWDNMLNEYTMNYTNEQAEAVATLLWNCGAATQMQYGSSADTADYDALNAFVKYFSYDPATIKQYSIDDFSPEEAAARIVAELQVNRPVYFAGENSSNNGSAFVIDGWNAEGYAHVNWGWGGNRDGYFLLTALDYVADKGYNYNQHMITGIQPVDEETPSATPEIWAQGNLEVQVIDGVSTFRASAGKIFNNSTVDATFDISLRFINRKTEEEFIATDFITVTLAQGEGLEEIANNFTYSLPDGNYKVQLIYRVADAGKWTVVRHVPYRSKNYVYATVKEGVLSYSNEDNVVDLQISNWQYEKIMNPRHENPVSFTIVNLAEKAYNDTLQLALYDSVSSSYLVVNKFAPALSPMETKEIKLMFGATKNDSTIMNGVYGMGVIDMQEFMFGECQSVVIDTTFNDESLQGDKLNYRIISDSLKTCEVIKGNYKGDIVIPQKVIIGKDSYQVVSIASGAFNTPDGATSVKIPSTVTSIDFYENFTYTVKNIYIDEENTVYKSEDGIVYSKDGSALLRYPGGRSELSSYIIPEGISRIGCGAFYESNIGIITLPESLTVIEDYAFEGSAITVVFIPKDVQTIGACAFSRTSRCSQIRIDANNLYFTVLEGVLFTKDMLSLIQYPLAKSSGNYKIPEVVQRIETMAFAGANNLSNVTLPSTLINIDSKAFYGCGVLSAVDIPAGVITIGDEAFAQCGSLKSIVIGKNVRSIGASAFAMLGSARTCLKSVTSLNTVPPVLVTGENESFDTFDYENAVLYVNDGCLDVYSEADGWKNFNTIRELTPEVNTLQYRVTSETAMTCEVIPGDYSGIVNIPGTVDMNGKTYTVTSIAEGCFVSSTGAVTVNIPRTVTNIAMPNFEKSVENIYVNEFNKNYSSEDGVLYNKDKSELICFPGGKLPGGHFDVLVQVKKIGVRAFFATKLKSILIPNGVIEIDSIAFAKSAIEEMNLPASIQTIGRGAFVNMKNCSAFVANARNKNFLSIDGVLYTTGNVKLVQYPIMRMGAMYAVPDGTLEIGNEAFMGVTRIERLNLPPTLEIIGENAYNGCNKIQYLSIPDNVMEIGRGAFANCTSLITIRIGRSVKHIGAGAFLSNTDNPSESARTSLLMIRSLNTVPPVIDTDEAFPAFDEYDFANVPLYVPEESIPLYKEADGWKKFRNIVVDEAEVSSPFQYEAISVGECMVTKGASTLNGEVVIPESFTIYGEEYRVVKIGGGAFKDCEFIKEIVIGKDVRSIGEEAFMNCTSLKKVVIKGGVDASETLEIGQRVFDGCRFIESIVVDRHNPPVVENSNAFLNRVYNNAILTVPGERKEAYRSASVWKNFLNIVEDSTLGIENVLTSGESIRIEGNSIVVEGGEASVYNIGGTLIARSIEGRVDDLAPGLYIVRVNMKAAKVIIK